MKTKNLNQKLVLNKRTIDNLNNKEMSAIHGGAITMDTCGETKTCASYVRCTEICVCTTRCSTTCP
jgi:hypothetical protein